MVNNQTAQKNNKPSSANKPRQNRRKLYDSQRYISNESMKPPVFETLQTDVASTAAQLCWLYANFGYLFQSQLRRSRTRTKHHKPDQRPCQDHYSVRRSEARATRQPIFTNQYVDQSPLPIFRHHQINSILGNLSGEGKYYVGLISFSSSSFSLPHPL